MKYFADCLGHWRNLQILSLKSSHINSDGAAAIGNGLRHCSNLRTLDLEQNSVNFGGIGMQPLSLGLQYCSN